jgi:hypothetical protein
VAITVFIVGGLATVVVTRQHDRSHENTSSGRIGSVPQPTTVTTTFLQNPQPPPLLNTGEDWDTIARSIVAYNDWLYAHPHPELLDQIIDPSNRDYANTKLGLTNLATQGWHYDPPLPPTVVQHVEMTTRMSPNRVGVVIRYGSAPEFRVVDQTGKVVQDTPAKTDGNTVEWTLVKAPSDDHWRLADVLAL